MSINGEITVAVAVLCYGELLLLATRQAHQHQGDKLEFIGGKVEQNECVQTALVREVTEEIGLDISDNDAVLLGKISHDYGDIAVVLHVYRIELDYGQYIDFKDKTHGLDGQLMGFYERHWVVTQVDRFPKANQQILIWLRDEM